MELVETLVKRGGPKILETCNEQGETPFLLCVRVGLHPLIATKLLEFGANPKIQDRQGKTALWHCAVQGDIAFAEELIQGGAAVDIPDEGTILFFNYY